MTSLSPRQEEMMEFIRRFRREKGYSPTVREIGRAVGLSSASTVQTHIETLIQKGELRRAVTTSSGGTQISRSRTLVPAKEELYGPWLMQEHQALRRELQAALIVIERLKELCITHNVEIPPNYVEVQVAEFA